MGMSLSKLRESVIDREVWHTAVHGVAKVGHELNWAERASNPKTPLEAPSSSLTLHHDVPFRTPSILGNSLLQRGPSFRRTLRTSFLEELQPLLVFSGVLCPAPVQWLPSGSFQLLVYLVATWGPHVRKNPTAHPRQWEIFSGSSPYHFLLGPWDLSPKQEGWLLVGRRQREVGKAHRLTHSSLGCMNH